MTHTLTRNSFIVSKYKNVKWALFLGVYLTSLTCRTNCLENYDFIIAGGGTGGLALARRLSESGKHSVLVLECGNVPKDGMDVPAYVGRFIRDPEVTFQHKSVPQKNAGLWVDSNGVMTIPVGRMLSGTSNLNLMWFNRGNPRDYDNWGNLTQDSSWNYANMLKYFKRTETYAGDFPVTDQHGTDGPILVTRPKYAPGLRTWLEAGRYLGYPTADANGPQQVSFTPVEFSKRHGRRVSAFVGYIQPILGFRPNLRIILNTNVTQIIFKGNNAIGVKFESKSPVLSGISDNTLYANREVIVSAGTYGSPQILQRSGIGPGDVLRAANIPVIKELPVGKNYQNHVASSIYLAINDRNSIMDEDRDLTPEAWEYFNRFGDGPYSNTCGATGQAFLVTSVAASEGESDWPDLQLFMSHSVQGYPSITELGFPSNYTLRPWEAPVLLSSFMNRPKSRGSIQINPTDPMGPPILTVGYLSDPKDVEKLLEGLKILVKLAEETPAYGKLGARMQNPDLPACRSMLYRSDEYWRCYIRYTSAVGNHAAGTCRMGRGADDHDAVVDTRLRVIGVTGLRVVDASIMPTVTNTNLQPAVYSIAEKAAEMILQDLNSF